MNCLNAADFGASGSSFETVGAIAAGSCALTVEDPGDFAVGQEVKIFGGAPRCESFRLFGPHGFHAKHRKVEREVELRFDGSAEAERLIYFLDFDPETCVFTLREPRTLKAGERYTLTPRYEDGREKNERLIHDNLVL